MSLLGNGQSDQELLEQQLEQEMEREKRQQEMNLAAQYSDEQITATDELLGLIQNLGLDSDYHDDKIEEFLSTELSHIFALSDFSPAEIDSFDWRSEQDNWMARNEMKDQDCKLDADDERIMFGSERATLTNSKQRRLRTAIQAKKALHRLAKNGGLREALTEIRTSSQSHRQDVDDEQDGGWLDKLV